MWYDETGLPWVLPSPNMPTLDTATVFREHASSRGQMFQKAEALPGLSSFWARRG